MTKVIMNDSRLININQLREFLKGTEKLDLSLRKASIEEKYAFVDQTVDRLQYHRLNRKEKRIIINYLRKFTGYKPAQLYRLIARAKRGQLTRKKYQRKHPHCKYSSSDIKLLEKTDELHLRLNARATKAILVREAKVFGHQDYDNIAQVSPSHINNLRKSVVYKNSWVNRTRSRTVSIGLAQMPEDYGRPGSLRVDTVHQRDLYHINAVDIVTQWEVVVCLPAISERFLKSALEQIIDQCPFTVFSFHSDRGSEYINYVVARLLSKLHIRQTKSRSRHPNDNALVETKNGAVIRKNMGWQHLDQGASKLINRYYRRFFNPYLNYHRPCLFVNKIIIDNKGRQHKLYQEAMPPYEKLKEISCLRKTNFLKKGLNFKKLDIIAYQHSDNEFAALLRREERKVFNQIDQINNIRRKRRKRMKQENRSGKERKYGSRRLSKD